MFGTLIPKPQRVPRALDRFEHEFERLLDRFVGGQEWPFTDAFVPQVNVAETDTAYEVTADLPGLKPEEFHVEVKAGELWITGAKKEEKEEKDKTFHRIERRHGEFRRIIPLPKTVAEDRVVAQYTNGVLKVTAPKTEEAKPRHIEVKAE